MDSVSHHGRTTAYRVDGADSGGTPVLFLHSSGADHRQWLEQRPLATQRPVVTLDLGGHGDSADVAASPGGETLAAYASDVVAVARETNARVIVGATLGAATAFRVALERSLPLDGLVMAGAGAKMAVLSDLLEWLRSDFEQAVSFLHRPGALFYDPDHALVERSQEMMFETGQAVTRRDFETCHRFDVRDRLDEIELPTLALVGEYDRLTPLWYHEYLADNMPNCGLGIVENAAHHAMLEQAGPFNEALRSFFDQLGV